MYQDQIFLDETECILNEKMMPDATVMVPDLEIGKKVSNIVVFGRKMWWYPGNYIIIPAGTTWTLIYIYIYIYGSRELIIKKSGARAQHSI
jgi:hypothetical protein